ncbi:hypothetical protein GQX74_004581 [Glossina fuscipes]|nr:hypothetical protein GQX74_004581 [Glossina fuscipes]
MYYHKEKHNLAHFDAYGRVNFRFSYDDDIYNIMQQAYFFACKYRCSCSRRVNALERHRYQEYKSKQIVFGSWRLLNGFYATLNRQQVFGIPVASHKVYSSKWSIHANVLRDPATT